MTFVCQKLTKTAVENTNSIDIKFYMLFCMQSTHTNTEHLYAIFEYLIEHSFGLKFKYQRSQKFEREELEWVPTL